MTSAKKPRHLATESKFGFALFFFHDRIAADPESYVNSLWNNFSYFSHVTLATLGYGDVIPAPGPYWKR